MRSNTMVFKQPGSYPENSTSYAPRHKLLTERLLSYVGPKTLFALVGGGVLVSAALVLTLITSVGPQQNKLVKGLSALAGVVKPVNGQCPAGYRLQVTGTCVYTNTAVQPLGTNLRLAIATTPATVPQGGSYTLSASYVDLDGRTQKYAGLLDYQLRLCQIDNTTVCQTSSGPWASDELVNGSVVVNLPSTIAVGVYNASFKPRSQTNWGWSNEISVTVVPASCNSQGISASGVTASASLPTTPPSLAVDGRTDTIWNSGGFAPQFITLDLGATYNLQKLCLFTVMTPDGQANHLIQVGSTPDNLSTVTSLNKALRNGQWEEVTLSATGRYVRIYTQQSPSWVAWGEIKVFGTQGTAGVPPTPTGCLTGSVVLTSNNIVVGTSTTVRSTLSGIAVTYETTNQNVATVNGATVTAGQTAGVVGIAGRFVYAGRSCSLTPASLTVTGGNVAGTVEASSNEIYLCVSNGVSSQATVKVTVTRGSGKVSVDGPVSFQGPTRLDAPNTWTQIVSPGNFIGLSTASGGKASVTISLKDYFTGQEIGSKTITVKYNPIAECGGAPAQPSVTNVSVAVCNGIGKAGANAIAPVQAKLVANDSYAIAQLDVPNTAVFVKNALIGPVTVGQTVRFSLQRVGGSVELASASAVAVRDVNCNVSGSVTATGTDLYLCTGNGNSNSVTVTVTVAQGSGKVAVNGPVSFQGPTRLDAPNTWTQTISPGNFIGLNSTSNGQLSVTIKLLDYFTGTEVASKTITVKLNPTGTCSQPGQSSLAVGTVYAACATSLSATASSLSATSATASTSRVVGNSRSLLSLDPNGSASQANVSIGYATDGNIVSFSLIEDGSNRVLAGPVSRTVQANPECVPTGTITPGNAVIGVCSNGQRGSVELIATITSSFGRGTVVKGSGQYTGTLSAKEVSPGSPASFTISASGFADKTAATFNIWSTGGAYVLGAGAVVYRDDAQACGGVSPTYQTFTVTPATATACPLSTKTISIVVAGATVPGYVYLNDNYNLTGTVGNYGLNQDVGLGVPQSGQRTYTVTLNLIGGPSVSKQVVLTADSSACAQPTADFSVNPTTMNICPGSTGQVLITIYNPTSGGSVRRGDGVVIGSFPASPTSTLGMRDDITVTEAMIGTSYTYDLILNNPNGGSLNLHRGSTYFARPTSGCGSPVPTLNGFNAQPSNGSYCANGIITVNFTVDSPSGPGTITGSNGSSFTFTANGLVSGRDTVSVGIAAGSVTYSLRINGIAPSGNNTSGIGWTIKTAGCTVPTPIYDLNLTAIDTTVCPNVNDTASMNFSGSVANMTAGYQAGSADEIIVSRDGQTVISRGFVANGSGGFVAGGSYTATTAGTYSVIMNFNGQIRQTRQVFITQSCATSVSGSISVDTSPTICSGQTKQVSVSASATGPGSVTASPGGIVFTLSGSGASYSGSGGVIISGDGATSVTLTLNLTDKPGADVKTIIPNKNGCEPVSTAAGRLSASVNPIIVVFGNTGAATITASNTGNVTLYADIAGTTYTIYPGSSRSVIDSIAVGTSKTYTLRSATGTVDTLSVSAQRPQ